MRKDPSDGNPSLVEAVRKAGDAYGDNGDIFKKAVGNIGQLNPDH